MKAILLYFFQVIACSGLLYGYYHFFLRNKKFHQYNRYFLLLTVFISIIIPFLQIPVYINAEEPNSPVVKTLSILSAGNFEDEYLVNASATVTTWFTAKNIFSLLYIAVGLFLFFRLLYAIWWVVKLANVSPGEQVDNIRFIQTDEPSSPFSFFRWLFWNKNIELNSDNGQQIFRHELFHIRQKHSWDIILLETITLVFWINPFFHLIKKEIKAIHEFLADQFAVLENREWDYAELLLMQVLRAKSTRLTNPFFHNQIKRRITMLTSSKKPAYQYLRKVMVLPLAAFVILLFAFTYKHKQNPFFSAPSAKPLTVVIDASHGGTDPGAKSPDNKFVESTLSLDIAKVIESLSKEYNINIVMTRSDDAFPGGASNKDDGLKNRVTIAGNAKADAFISIHINAAAPADQFQSSKSGIEAYVSQSRNDEGGKKLASYILHQLAPVYQTSTDLKYRDNTGIYVLDKMRCPSVLLELGYINNADDMAFFSNKQNQEKIARNILAAIAGFETKKDEMALVTTDTIPKKQATQDGNKIFVKVETEAAFKGGVDAWAQFLKENLDGSVATTKNAPAGHYTVFIQFVVDKDGKVSDVKPLTKHGYGMEAEATRVINISPDWIPAMQNGKIVNAYRKQPINFRVKKDAGTLPDGSAVVALNNEVVAIGYPGKKSLDEVVVTGQPGKKPLDEVTVVGHPNKKSVDEVPVVGHPSKHNAKDTVLNNKPVKSKEIPQSPAAGNPDPLKEVVVQGYPSSKATFEQVEVRPSFPGGDAAWRKYLERNVNPMVPVDKGAPGGIYKVIVQYIVRIDGSITDIKPVTSHGFGMEEEGVRLMQNSPSWIPAMQNGKKVNAYQKQPITFMVSEEVDEKKKPESVTPPVTRSASR